MEQFKEKAVSAAEAAAKTAKYLAFVAKTKMEIRLEKEKIRRLYAKLGKVYYKDYVTDEEPDEAEYKPLCELISDSFRRINALKDALEDAKEEYNSRPDEAEIEEDFEEAPEEKPEEGETE